MDSIPASTETAQYSSTSVLLRVFGHSCSANHYDNSNDDAADDDDDGDDHDDDDEEGAHHFSIQAAAVHAETFRYIPLVASIASITDFPEGRPGNPATVLVT